MSLKNYLEGKNLFSKAMGWPLYTLPLDQTGINHIAESIDCDLSPENLHCDGEISNAEANRKYNKLCRAFAELKSHAKKQGLGITVKVYEID